MKDLHMAGEICMAELVQPQVTGADLDYRGSITIDREALTASGLLTGQMVYIDNLARQGPPWRTYIIPGQPGKGEIIMNGPPAHHFRRGDLVTIRGSALISSENIPSMASGHTKVYFSQDKSALNRVARVEHVAVPTEHWREMCISKLHRLEITESTREGPEMLIVDADILDAGGFPPGIEVQFTSLKDGALRRTCIQAGPRGTGMAEVHGAGAQYVSAGSRIITLAEMWIPYDDAVKAGAPRVVLFDETFLGRNVIL